MFFNQLEPLSKKAPSPGSHVFQTTRIIFELVQGIIWTNPLTKCHENLTINVAYRVFTSHINTVETNLLTKFHEEWTVNVASIVLSRQKLTPLDTRQRKSDHKSSP
ncbi:hypothetical protein DPMN_125281 [Dreissena polymorpha]|uniref:Uncharacterized protein n=1 Tax=Dreissena polymorpha TaxID=45954 RepID=A0A9D4JWY2_DREPO|nr:hypothetical protein DPMN_125281 [Dreissena polymorpha]